MEDCKDQNCSCNSDKPKIDRRDFLKTTAIGASLMMVPGIPMFAGPFNENDYLKYIPADKKLDPAWVKSLFERGSKGTYTDPAALNHIGMPVGGLFAGTVYLSGDGRIWLWDIFNRDQEGIQPKTVEVEGKNVRMRDGANFVEPALVKSPFEQGFELIIGGKVRPLNQEGFKNIVFDGRYPLARVTYTDPDCPVEVVLEAFSPFIPLNADDSSLPATVMSYTLINKSKAKIECSLRGFTENPVCIDSADDYAGLRQNRIVKKNKITSLVCEALPAPIEKAGRRDDILFEDFESGDYGKWKTSGKAFGEWPVHKNEVPEYQGKLGGEGDWVVNSHSNAPGDSVGEKDQQMGKLTSPEFTIVRDYINFYIGGGAHKGKTCVNLIIDGEVKSSITGKNQNSMDLAGFLVSEWSGKSAHLEVVDDESGAWGNIGVDHIVFSDNPPESRSISELRDFGTFSLSVLGKEDVNATALFGEEGVTKEISSNLSDSIKGSLAVKVDLEANQSKNCDFAFTWFFPNFYGRDFGGVNVGHSYASRFDSALDVAQYLDKNKDELFGITRQWVDTWYDSSLPYWLLDRAMANTSTLATNTCYRFKDGRFWAWEGIGCCTGTCTHVWHYAQAVGRIFPEIERDQRERIDFGMALKDTGEIGYRALLESSMGPAFDGQCGRIMGAYREHLMSANNEFLKRNWTAVKKAIQYMIDKDIDFDGILEGSQPNTLDASWYGKISFISSLYISALRAGEKMAIEMDDNGFAKTCSTIAEKGARNILDLYNGDFFIQIEDPEHKDVIGVGTGCYIDQIFGQTWAHWTGMGSIFDREKQLTALEILVEI